MPSSLQLTIDGTPVDDDLYAHLDLLEVEENADLPGAIQLSMPVIRTDDGELGVVNRFKPFTTLVVVASAEGGAPQCIFNGFVLSQKLHLETGTVNSTLEVWGQDISWLMNLEERTQEWVNMTDAQVANKIFEDHDITPAPENLTDDAPAHTEEGHSLMQRASDIQFLQKLAKGTGKLCRVVCGESPLERIGYFAKPKLDGDPVACLTLNDPETWTVQSLDIDWDVARPNIVNASQVLFTDTSGEVSTLSPGDSGLGALDARRLSEFAGRPMTVMVAPPVGDGGELLQRARAVLRDAEWFVRCEGETEVSRLNAVLRVGSVVQIERIGSLHSGKYFVWSVRHSITKDAHRMKFVLVRNAVGPEPSGGGSLLGGS